MMLHGARAVVGPDRADIKLACSRWAPIKVWDELVAKLNPAEDLRPQLPALSEAARQLLASVGGHVQGR